MCLTSWNRFVSKCTTWLNIERSSFHKCITNKERLLSWATCNWDAICFVCVCDRNWMFKYYYINDSMTAFQTHYFIKSTPFIIKNLQESRKAKICSWIHKGARSQDIDWKTVVVWLLLLCRQNRPAQTYNRLNFASGWTYGGCSDLGNFHVHVV